MQESVIIKRKDGIYEEKLDDKWIAEYSEDVLTGLFQVEIFYRSTSEWVSTDYLSLEDAQNAAHDYYDTRVE